MQIIFKASCSCGYSKDLNLKGSQFSFLKEIPVFPCYCIDCKSLFELKLYGKSIKESSWLEKLFKKNMSCAECGSKNFIPYDKLFSPDSDKADNFEVFNLDTETKLGRNLILDEGKYLCPECNKYELSFKRKLGNLDD